MWYFFIYFFELNIQNPELEDQQNAADLQRIQTQINELVGILGDNMQKLLERSDNLEDMEKLAEKLQDRVCYGVFFWFFFIFIFEL